MTLLTKSKRDADSDLLTLAEAAIQRFESNLERQALVEREQTLRGELSAIERELAGLHPSPSEDPAVAMAEGRDPAPEVREQVSRERAALAARRVLLLRALEVLARKRGEADARVAREVLECLIEPYGRLVAEQARRVRAVAEANDVLARVSGDFERAGLLGASAVLLPMIFHPAGPWGDAWSAARHYWREATEHGFVRDTD